MVRCAPQSTFPMNQAPWCVVSRGGSLLECIMPASMRRPLKATCARQIAPLVKFKARLPTTSDFVRLAVVSRKKTIVLHVIKVTNDPFEMNAIPRRFAVVLELNVRNISACQGASCPEEDQSI